jgi:hypothetical protein
LVAVSAAALLAGASAAIASPTPTPVATAKVNCVSFDEAGVCRVTGVVYAMTQLGDRTYIGGSFTSVSGAPRSNVAAIGADGTLDPNWNPSTDGVVYAMAASSDGTKIFLGGGFTTVGGQSRGRLAAVTPDTGQLITTWKANASSNNVRALVADSADRLYVGGNFGAIGGRAVPRLAAVSQSTGAVDMSFAPQPNNTVRVLALSRDGSKLYAGGAFTTMGTMTRPGAAELLSDTGAVTTFAPVGASQKISGVVLSMDITPSGRLFFGTFNNRTWAFDTGSDNREEYVVRTSGDVQAILATDTEVYIGGHFSGFPETNVQRLHIASFLTHDGQATDWNPGVNGDYGVWALGLTQTPLSPTAVPALSVGGDFTTVAGLARRGYARFNL